MKPIALGLLLLVGTPLAVGPLERLRAKVAVVSASDAAGGLAGKYSSGHPELRERHLWPPGGRNLYLFPDQTYVYCEWGDVLGETVYDKGNWHVHDGRVDLESDPEVTWPARGQRAYVAVRRVDRPTEVLMVGVDWDLPQFEANAGGEAAFMLLLHSYVRLERLERSTSAGVKADLMSRAWNPQFFKSKQP